MLKSARFFPYLYAYVRALFNYNRLIFRNQRLHYRPADEVSYCADTEDDEDNVLNAVIHIYLETEDQYSFIDWMAVAEFYKDKDEKSKKDAVHSLLTDLNNFMKEDLDNGEADSFWEFVDKKKKQWEQESDDENNIWKVITEYNDKLIEEMKEKNPAINELATRLGLEQC